jgi:hypothetical protein
MKLPTAERGDIEVLAIEVRDGRWEDEWEPLRGTIFGKQFSAVRRQDVDHALHGLSRPLSAALGIPPAGALRKVPKPSRACYVRPKCPFYEPRACHVESSAMPWCFEPDEVEDETIRQTAAKAISMWREGVYLLTVED